MSSPLSLPIYEVEPALLRAWQERPERRRFVIEAPTGSGKSTQLPQILYRQGLLKGGSVVILQPRRIAARMLARRVAQEMGTALGAEVGYQVRFENVTSGKTRIRFVTEGEPVDHLVSEGRTYPVTVKYAPPRAAVRGDVWDHAARVCGEAVSFQREGHVLIFMPGAFEIRKTMEAIGREKWSREFEILPLHGELSPAQQDAAVSEGGRRRIIVATNVAETSLTIEGVRTVIDSGLARQASWDANRGINTLTIQPIARSSADQRAGRAGRTAEGECWRLWSGNDHGRRPAAEIPEVLRLDLAEVVLTLKAAGVEDLAEFRWFEAPDPRSLERAAVLLTQLGALDAAGALTGEGRRLTRYPLHPRQARLMEAAAEYGCLPAMALLVGLQQGRSLFVRGGGEAYKQWGTPDDFSDFLPLLRGWQAAAERQFHPDACGAVGLNGRAAAEAGKLASQLMGIAGARRDASWELPDHESLAKAVLAGYSDQVAKRTSSGGSACEVVGGRRGSASKESIVRGTELLVAAEISEVQGKELTVTLSLLTEITEDWLGDLFPEDFHLERAPFFDVQQRRVSQRERVRFRDLVLRDRQTGEAEPHAAAALLAEEVLRGNLTLNEWNNATRQWLARLNFLRKVMPDLEIPEFTTEDHRLVLESLFDGCRTYKEIKDLPPLPALRDWLGPAKASAMDRHAPERIATDGGKMVRIDYTRPEEPSVAVFIQQLYSQRDTPKIAGGRVPLVLSILAPNHRPLQVTRDLAGFWKNHYPAIRKEMLRRYPRHEWREM